MTSLSYDNIFFFFNDTATTEIYTLSLHDALPICGDERIGLRAKRVADELVAGAAAHRDPPYLSIGVAGEPHAGRRDRKSTRLNSSHANISYAVFCLKKKKKIKNDDTKKVNILTHI